MASQTALGTEAQSRRRILTRRQSVDDAAVRDDITPAIVDHPVKLGLQGLQVGDLSLDLLAVLLSNGIDRSAGLASIIRQGEEGSNLV